MSMNNNQGSGLGSLIASILQIILVGILALYAKRSSFFRPFYWYVVQLGAVFVGMMVSVVVMGMFALMGLYGNDVVEIIALIVWGLVTLGSISEIHVTMEQIEKSLFDNVFQLSDSQKVLGFIYGILLHCWVVYKYII